MLEHTWCEATCVAPMTCEMCGTTEGEAAHEYAEATYWAPATCTLCGVTLGDVLPAEWSKASYPALDKNVNEEYEFKVTDKTTAMKLKGCISYSSASEFAEDETHAPKAGYVWNSIRAKIAFKNVEEDMILPLSCGLADYYTNDIGCEKIEEGHGKFTIVHDDSEYVECEYIMAREKKYEDGTLTVYDEWYVLVPNSYDGLVLNYYSSDITVINSTPIRLTPEIVDEDKYASFWSDEEVHPTLLAKVDEVADDSQSKQDDPNAMWRKFRRVEITDDGEEVVVPIEGKGAHNNISRQPEVEDGYKDELHVFVDAVNAEREALGLDKLIIDDFCQEHALIRAEEISEDFRHAWWIFGGEVILLNSTPNFSGLDAKEQFKSSAPHWNILMNPDNKYIGFGLFVKDGVSYGAGLLMPKEDEEYNGPPREGDVVVTEEEYMEWVKSLGY